MSNLKTWPTRAARLDEAQVAESPAEFVQSLGTGQMEGEMEKWTLTFACPALIVLRISLLPEVLGECFMQGTTNGFIMQELPVGDFIEPVMEEDHQCGSVR